MAEFDQRAVDGLIFVRRFVVHYLETEWGIGHKDTRTATAQTSASDTSCIADLPENIAA
jgi:hypothetical protein